jgi:multiple sugar transport system substrate-binding protein
MASMLNRRHLLCGAASIGAANLALRGQAPAQGGAKPLQGVKLNVACWSGPYPQFLGQYIHEFESATGAQVNYETPAASVYNQRADLELSTRGSAYDVLNITFIYSSRWIGAGWFQPLDDLIKDPGEQRRPDRRHGLRSAR